ncbi:MAG: TetR/AcrR family transcriptional regulator [Woeseiaceae bacterium]|nr:TetR/AcrR family transcriptional regulator [Woeseiaceae bacterium]
MAGKDTRTRILVASLILFNEQGEPNTTTNQIADEVDISPGNLHYHFRRKSDIVDALLAEFQADARRVLATPDTDATGIPDFWAFVQSLAEMFAAYRFLFRDIDTLTSSYPQVARSLQGFVRALSATAELHVRGLSSAGKLAIAEPAVAELCRSIAVVAMFSDRFDALRGLQYDAGRSALNVARSTLALLRPHATDEACALIDQLLRQYA